MSKDKRPSMSNNYFAQVESQKKFDMTYFYLDRCESLYNQGVKEV